jgi:hypothetical protein
VYAFLASPGSAKTGFLSKTNRDLADAGHNFDLYAILPSHNSILYALASRSKGEMPDREIILTRIFGIHRPLCLIHVTDRWSSN